MSRLIIFIILLASGCGDSDMKYSASDLCRLTVKVLNIFSNDNSELAEVFGNTSIVVNADGDTCTVHRGVTEHELIITYANNDFVHSACRQAAEGCFIATRRITINKQYLNGDDTVTKHVLVHELVHYLLYVKYLHGDDTALAKSYNHEMPYYSGSSIDIFADCYVNDILYRL
jgi:hypothetical protein